ncbi:MAG: Na+/H+ antiporter subunit E [Desulfatiglandaceae bacterium]
MKKLQTYNLFFSFIGLMVFWVAMSGYLDAFHIGLGILCAGVVIAFNYRLKTSRFFDFELEDLHNLRVLKIFSYLLWLAYQILLSGFRVAFVIINPRMPIETHILKFKTRLPHAQAKMVLGNSITLTPGTLTVDIVDDEFTVHALTRESATDILNDNMPRHVFQLFSDKEIDVIYDLEIIASLDNIK